LDEMNGLTPEQTDQRLNDGQQVLQRWFGQPARGFIAPTFQIGHATPDRLARHGIEYTVGYRYLVDAAGQRLRLATWCWDVSPLRTLNYAGHLLGEVQYKLHKHAIPCLALHPLDLGRGFLPRIVRTVKKLLAAGRTPTLLESNGLAAKPQLAAAR
jgi:predicted deacetylase